MENTNNVDAVGIESTALFDLCRSMLNESSDRENLRAPEDDLVRELCERIGFVAVMDSAARQWRKKDPIGAFLVGPCIGTVEYELKKCRSNEQICNLATDAQQDSNE